MNEKCVIEKYVETYKDSYKDNVLVIMVGVPGSGKTTVSKFLENEGIAKISTDDLKSFYENEEYQIKDLFILQYKIIETLMKLNIGIVADSNSDKEVFREILKELAKKYNYRHEIIYCFANKDTINKRMQERKKIGKFYVPPDKIDKFFDELEIPIDSINVNTNLDLNYTNKQLLEIVAKIKSGGKENDEKGTDHFSI